MWFGVNRFHSFESDCETSKIIRASVTDKHKQNRKLIYFYVSLLVETAGFAKNKTNLFLAENWEKLCQDNLCFYTDDNNNSSERTDSDNFVLPEAFFGFV